MSCYSFCQGQNRNFIVKNLPTTSFPCVLHSRLTHRPAPRWLQFITVQVPAPAYHETDSWSGSQNSVWPEHVLDCQKGETLGDGFLRRKDEPEKSEDVGLPKVSCTDKYMPVTVPSWPINYSANIHDHVSTISRNFSHVSPSRRKEPRSNNRTLNRQPPQRYHGIFPTHPQVRGIRPRSNNRTRNSIVTLMANNIIIGLYQATKHQNVESWTNIVDLKNFNAYYWTHSCNLAGYPWTTQVIEVYETLSFDLWLQASGFTILPILKCESLYRSSTSVVLPPRWHWGKAKVKSHLSTK